MGMKNSLFAVAIVLLAPALAHADRCEDAMSRDMSRLGLGTFDHPAPSIGKFHRRPDFARYERLVEERAEAERNLSFARELQLATFAEFEKRHGLSPYLSLDVGRYREWERALKAFQATPVWRDIYKNFVAARRKDDQTALRLRSEFPDWSLWTGGLRPQTEKWTWFGSRTNPRAMARYEGGRMVGYRITAPNGRLETSVTLTSSCQVERVNYRDVRVERSHCESLSGSTPLSFHLVCAIHEGHWAEPVQVISIDAPGHGRASVGAY